jgi:hypothetical protein
MKRLIVVALLLAGCKSAAEKAHIRDSLMIAQAKEDAAAEAEFVEDSVKLAASITVDTVREVRSVQDTVPDEDSVMQVMPAVIAVSPSGTRCTLTTERSRTILPGDTLTCQWAVKP